MPDLTAEQKAEAAAYATQHSMADAYYEPETPAGETVDAPTKPEVAEPVVPEPKTYKHSASLKMIARSYGFTDEKMAGMSPELLDATCTQLMEQTLRQPDPSLATVTQLEEEEEKVVLSKKLKDRLDEEVVEELESLLTGISKKTNAKAKATEAKLAAFEQAEQKRAHQTLAQQIDSGFARLNSSMLGGTAAITRLKDPQAIARRKAVVNSLIADRQEISADAVHQRAKELFGLPDPEQKPAKQKGKVIKPEEWDEAGTAIPAATTPKAEQKGVQTAVQKLAKRLRDVEQTEAEEEGLGGL